MLGYSMPCHSIGGFPAELGVPTMLGTLTPWASVISGGVYAYVERIFERAGDDIAVHLGARIMAVRRDERGVEVSFEDNEPVRFDKVVFATTPDQVLALLSDATLAERHGFRSGARTRPRPSPTPISLSTSPTARECSRPLIISKSRTATSATTPT